MTESWHHVHVVLADPDGRVLAAAGAAGLPTYVRSAAKPFQVSAVRDLLTAEGVTLEGRGLAIATSSHVGTDDQQIEAAHLLARAGLDESALRCPPALPADVASMVVQGEPTRLAHNCSGKHASFLLAQVASGADPARYLDQREALQRAVRDALAEATSAIPEGPGVDGCGAPAWVLPLSGLAVGFARLAAGTCGLAPVAEAMRTHADLVGGPGCDDTALMDADARVVAKRGAEAVLGAGRAPQHGSVGRPLGDAVGVAVKVADGSNRAGAPVVAAVLAGLGLRVPAELRAPVVLGGGEPHGAVEVDPEGLARLLATSQR